MAAIGLLALPPLADIANAVVKPAEGCRVWGVIDGDTVRLHCPGVGVVTGRLLGFDTPEKQADCPSEFLKAMAATQYLRWQLLSAATISTRTEGRDRYGRRLTVLLLDGQDVAEPMVDARLARRYDGGRRAGWCGQERSLGHV